MTGLDRVREKMTEFLRAGGLEAVTAWSESGRGRIVKPVAAVSLRACQGGPAGFQDYLGERYNADAGRWEELYGKKTRLTFGLDLYAGRGEGGGEGGLRAAFDLLTQRFQTGGPEGLRLTGLAAGETGYDQSTGLFHCPVEVCCEAYLYAVADEGGAFLDFEIRGERT